VRRGDAQSNPLPVHGRDRHANFAANDDFFADASSED
jgi:hypothetical protein